MEQVLKGLRKLQDTYNFGLENHLDWKMICQHHSKL